MADNSLEMTDSTLLDPGLYLVATPIGNLGDISRRAIETLQNVDVIYCEDTRTSRTLLQACHIRTPCRAYHDHSGDSVRQKIVADIVGGKRCALISDAGMPLVSDPGYKLVQEALERAVMVTVIPGPSAGQTALLLSGLPCDRHVFLGFAPPKSKARRDFFTLWKNVPATLVLYESKHRIDETLADALTVFGDRPAALARELTKKFEEIRRLSLSGLCQSVQDSPPKGELVIVIGGAPEGNGDISDEEIGDKLFQLQRTMSLNDAAKQLSVETGRKKKDIYTLGLALKDKDT